MYQCANVCCLAGAPGPLAGLFGADGALRSPQRLQAATQSGLRHTVLRFQSLKDGMGGQSYLEFNQDAGDTSGAESSGNGAVDRSSAVSREDAALVLVRALAFPPAEGSGLVFSARALPGRGTPPSQDDWAAMFGRLQQSQAEPLPASAG